MVSATSNLGDPVETPRSSDEFDLESAQKQPLNPSPRDPQQRYSLLARSTSKDRQQEVVSDDPRTKRSVVDLGIEGAELLELEEDVYSAAIFTLTFDVSELYSTEDADGLDIRVNLYRAVYTLALLGVNYALQVGLIIWVYWYVAAPALHRAQTVYQKYHAEVFSDGEFMQDRWDVWEDQEALCRIAFSNYWFMYAILSLWWIAMVTEVTKTHQVFMKIHGLGHTDDASQMVLRRGAPTNPSEQPRSDSRSLDGSIHDKKKEDRGERENLVWQLLLSVRVMFVLLIFIPRLAIAAGLWWVGTVWLAATDSFENLVLNSVALTFIIQIDEQIFAGLIPGTMKDNIRITKLVKVLKEHEHESDVKVAYMSVTFYLLFVVFGVAAYMSEYGQSIPYMGIFPGYAHDNDFACPKLWERQRSQICSVGKDCFPRG